MKKQTYEPTEDHRASPVQFSREVLGTELWSKQEEVLEALRDYRRVAVKSGNGLGKGFSAAVAILWFLTCHDPSVVLSTAPTFRQVRHVLWREVHRRYNQATYSLGGRLLDTRLEMSEGRFALGLSADSGEEFQGFHSPNMLIVVDEAEGVSEPIYEAIEAVMTSENCRLLMIGNPTTMSGSFRRAFYEDRDLYRTVTISALDSPNVTEGKTNIRGLTTKRWVEERRKVWGEENPLYQARVLGEFPDQGEDTLIPLSYIEAAVISLGAQSDDDGNPEEDPSDANGSLDPVVIAVERGPVRERQERDPQEAGHQGRRRPDLPRHGHDEGIRARGGRNQGVGAPGRTCGRGGHRGGSGGPAARARLPGPRSQRRPAGPGQRALRQSAGRGILEPPAARPGRSATDSRR